MPATHLTTLLAHPNRSAESVVCVLDQQACLSERALADLSAFKADVETNHAVEAIERPDVRAERMIVEDHS